MTKDFERYVKVYREFHPGHNIPAHMQLEVERLQQAGISPEEYAERQQRAREMLETGEVDFSYLMEKARAN